jgi:hypothetical protein
MLRSGKKRTQASPDEYSEQQYKNTKPSKRTKHSTANVIQENGKEGNDKDYIPGNSKRSRTEDFQQPSKRRKGSKDVNEYPKPSSNSVSEIPESTSYSKSVISDQETNFLRLTYFICTLVTKAVRDWWKYKYPRSKLMDKQKKLKNLRRKRNDLSKIFRDIPEEEASGMSKLF